MRLRKLPLTVLFTLLGIISAAFTSAPTPAASASTAQRKLPDLIVKQYQVVDAKTGKIKLLIRNQGNADAPAAKVDIWLPIKPGSDEHYPRDEPAVAQGQEVWVEIHIGYDVSGRRFYAMADVYEQIQESVETNNRISGTF